jgi:hypothetical protein
MFLDQETVASAFENGVDKLTVDKFTAVIARGNNTDPDWALRPRI